MADHGTDEARGLAPRPLPPGEREPWPSFLRTMGWIGLNSFGGPVAQIGVMREQAVDRRRWLTDAEFVHLLNFANVLPGPEALEIAIHLGWLRRGWLGGVLAGLLFVWPGFVSLTLLAWVYQTWGEVAVVRGLLDGIRPVAAALVVYAVIRLSAKALQGPLAWGLLAVAFVAHAFAGVPFLPLLLGCGALGVALAPWRRQAGRGHPAWLAALVVLALATGYLWPQGDVPTADPLAGSQTRQAASLGSVAWVNLQAALVTFGGAYTALPFLREQMVAVHPWLTDVQVIDGLALGETTPGPLISVAVFLSYLAAGLPGACVGAVALFLPSFVLVLGLGPHIERVERLPRSADFLWGVSAGTIGLILALSAQVVPASVDGWFAAVVAAVALATLWRWQANPLLTVVAGALVGLAWTAVG